MTTKWLEIESEEGASERVPLKAGLTRLGGPGTDHEVAGWRGGELHVWDDPAKVVYPGGGLAPALNGHGFEEASLRSGDRITWGGTQMVFVDDTPVKQEPEYRSGSALVEEVSVPPPAHVGGGPLERWMHAGLLVELGLADRKEAKRWQDAVLRGEFAAEPCSRDVLRGEVPGPEDPRVLQRAERLVRDLVMAPVGRGARGAGRRARGAAKSGVAFFVAQLLAIVVYTAVILVIMLLARVKWDLSFDGFFDGILGR